MAQTTYSGYTAVTVTIPNDGASHNILALVQAIEPMASPRSHYMTIQNDPDGSNDSVLIGSAATDGQGANNPGKLTATNFGVKVVKGGSITFQGFRDEDFNAARYYAQTKGIGTVQLNVQLVRG